MMGWIEEVKQTAVIDEAEQLAARYLLPEFADVRATYAAISFDALAFATELRALTDEARQARAESAAAQGRYEAESGQSREVVTGVGKWLEQLRLGARFAAVSGHPFGDSLVRMYADLSADSWSKARDSVELALANLRTDNLQRFGLPADFVARGEALATALQKERGDTHVPWVLRSSHSDRLQVALDRIVAAFEKIAAARDLAMALTGKNIPGLELSLVRSAAAPSGSPAPAPPPSPASGGTGLV